MAENTLKYPAKLKSNNPNSFGIVDAVEVSGFKQVTLISDLYTLKTPILSKKLDGTDAVGQEWFVQENKHYYRLKDWTKRGTAEGWEKILDKFDNNIFEGNVSFNGITKVLNDTESTSPSTGAFVVIGGVGIGKRLNVGSYINAKSGFETSYVAGSYVNSLKRSALHLTGTGFIGIFDSPTKSGRLSLSTYSTDDILYFGFETTGEISAGTNSFSKVLKWDILNQNLISTKFTGALVGNASTATKLQTPRTINGTNFDGSTNITTATWGTSRNISIASSDGTGESTAISINGGANAVLKLPSTIKASLIGNATSSSKLIKSLNITNLDTYVPSNGVGQLSTFDCPNAVTGRPTLGGSQLGGFVFTPYTDYHKIFAFPAAAGNGAIFAVKEIDAKTANKKWRYVATGDSNGNALIANSAPWSGISGKPSSFTPSSHTHPIEQISDLNSGWDGLLKSAPSVYVTRWPSIGEVTSKQSLIIKLNGGTTEGTNQFTYNATTAKSLNITPSSIGAAAASHTHAWTQITGAPAQATRWPTWNEVTSKPSSFTPIMSSGVDWNAIFNDSNWGFFSGQTNSPYSGGSVIGISIPLKSTANYGMQFAARNNRAFFRTKENNVNGSWLEFYHTGHKPDWSEVTNKPSSFTPSEHTHLVFRNNLLVKGTNGMSDSAAITLALGDNDTGFQWVSDGNVEFKSNGNTIGRWNTDGINWSKAPKVNGKKIWYEDNDGNGSGLDADMLDGIHASSLVKYQNGHFSQYKKGVFTKIVEFTINKSDLRPSISFTWQPTENARDIWADFNITIRDTLLEFSANWKGRSQRELWCVGDGTTYSVWVKGDKNNYDPYGILQLVSYHCINSYRFGALAYSDTEPTGTYKVKASITGVVKQSQNSDMLNWKPLSKFVYGESNFGSTNISSLNDLNRCMFFRDNYSLAGNSGNTGVYINHTDSPYGFSIACNYDLDVLYFRRKTNGNWGNVKIIAFTDSNVASATKLQTPRRINGVSFDGTSDITITANPNSHNHPWTQITGAPVQATRWPSWNEVSGKPSTFTPSSHSHTISQISDRNTGWDALLKAAPSGYVTRWPSWNEVSDKPSTFTPSSHEHQRVQGIYTGNGGSVAPNYVTSGYVRFNMCRSNMSNNSGNYIDTILMDTYSGGDVPYVTYLGIEKASSPKLWIGSGPKGNSNASTWVVKQVALMENLNWDTISGKPSTFTPSSHTHSWSQISSIPSTASRWPSWDEVSGKPSTFTPSSHTHDDRYYTESEINSKLSGYAPSSHNHDGIYIKGNTTSSQSTQNITITGAFTAKTFYKSSDKRLKSNISLIDTSTIEAISKIETKSFILHNSFNQDDEGLETIGYIAQEVEKHKELKKFVSEIDGVKKLDYESLLVAKIASLEYENSVLKERLEKIEKLLNL